MLPDFLFCSLFPVQQTTSGIGHRVKYRRFFGLATNTLNVRSKVPVSILDPKPYVISTTNIRLVPSPSETWFRGLSVGSSFRRE